MRYSFPFSLLPSGRKARFMAMLLFVSLLAHLFVIDWARNSLALVSHLDEDENVVQITLHTAQTPQTQEAALPKPLLLSPAPDKASKSAAVPVPVPETPSANAIPPENNPTAVSDSAPEVQPNDLTEKISDSAIDPVVAPAPEAEDELEAAAALTSTTSTPHTEAGLAMEMEAATVAAETAVAATENPAIFSQFSLPPSADLGYDAIAIKGSSKVEGRGQVKWVQDGLQYSISGEASILFLSVLSYRSEGHLSEAGILPERYVEKRVGKSATNTHFHRERQTISFSASTHSYPVKGGEQDRGSVFWQLAGLARGNPDKLHAGLSFDLIIAGNRTADLWRVTILGREPVALRQGIADAWHMSIVRQDGGFDYQLQVWIAPEQDWYPVKIMYVDRKGTSLGLTLSTLEKK